MHTSGSIAQRLGEQEGTTLIELAVYIVLSLVILTAALTFVVDGFHQQNTIESRTAASGRAEAGLEQLVGDLRQAITSVSASRSGTTTTLSFYLPTPGNDMSGEAVTWACTDDTTVAVKGAPQISVGNCTRTLNGMTKTEISGINSITLTPISSAGTTLSLPLSSVTDVAYIGIALNVDLLSQINPTLIGGKEISAVPASTTPITLQAGADLSNFS